jgi:hypothetical protein
MATAPQRGRPRLSAFLSSGVTKAYALVIGLTLACVAVVHAGLKDEPVRAAQATDAASLHRRLKPLRRRRRRDVGSLKLPPQPTDFRVLPVAEREAMVETAADGLRLPKTASSGWMPWIAYARRYAPDGPPARAGLLMINVGADEALMRRAIDELPDEVSLAFLPGTPDLGRWMTRAREHGHESYLMLPVEDPTGTVERGIRPIEASAEAENLRGARRWPAAKAMSASRFRRRDRSRSRRRSHGHC